MSASGEGGVLVGGEPLALLEASTAARQAGAQAEAAALRLAGIAADVLTTVAATTLFAPARAARVTRLATEIAASPTTGLAVVVVAYEVIAAELQVAGQALEAAGAVGLVASGTIGLLRGERPTVLESADGVDLSRQVGGFSASVLFLGGGSTTAVREVRRPDGTTFYVVEATMSAKVAASNGYEVNGVGAFAEAAAGSEVTARWAVATRREAELLVAAAAGGLAGRALLGRFGRPTELGLATTGSLTATGGIVGLPTGTSGGSVTVRNEITSLRTGGERFSSTISGTGQASLPGVAATGGAGSVRVSVDRSPDGAITRLSLTTTTEVDRGRRGNPVVENMNREATLEERQYDVELTPERRAAAERITEDLAGLEAPDRADVAILAEAVRTAEVTEATYDVRHQLASVDVVVGGVGVGAAGSVDTATLRRP